MHLGGLIDQLIARSEFGFEGALSFMKCESPQSHRAFHLLGTLTLALNEKLSFHFSPIERLQYYSADRPLTRAQIIVSSDGRGNPGGTISSKDSRQRESCLSWKLCLELNPALRPFDCLAL